MEAVDPEAKVLTSPEVETFEYDLAVLIPPTGAPASSTPGRGMGGWIPVDRATLRVEGQEDVYAIGEATNLPISKSGSTTHFEALDYDNPPNPPNPPKRSLQPGLPVHRSPGADLNVGSGGDVRKSE